MAAGAKAEPVFNRIASLLVPMNLPADMDQATQTSAEIIAATEDGMTLIDTGSPLGAVGIINITDPKAPAASDIVMLEGEPTSIAVADGEIEEEIGFPDELMAVEKRFGAEGITIIGEGDALTLWIAIQREWRDDKKDMVKLVSYTPATETWGAVAYPLEKAGDGWIGLSEITALGDHVYIVERDNQIGQAAMIKKLYRVPLAEMQPAELGGDLPVVTKEEARDFIPDLQAFGGYVVDKIEGFAIDAAGDAFAVTDNDGVDDSSGETFFLKLGRL